MAATAFSEVDRNAPTRCPPGSPIGYQVWRDLAFLHWRVRASEIEPLIPAGLTLDTFAGEAWVGLVAFGMSGLRPWWLPPLPGISRFLETNVRTYVHRDGADPGVWFFSLDASNPLAVLGARWKWGLNYHRAKMRLSRRGDDVRYESVRRCPGGYGSELEVRVGAPLRSGPLVGQAAPGTLEHFLAERYILYSRKPGGPLKRARVHHCPYRLREAEVRFCRQTLTEAAGLLCCRPPHHVMFSDGVHVRIFQLRTVG